MKILYFLETAPHYVWHRNADLLIDLEEFVGVGILVVFKEERYSSTSLPSAILALDICWIREVNELTSCSISAYRGWTRKLCRVSDCWRISESSRGSFGFEIAKVAD